MYRYETHCHSAPVSRCARATVRETIQFYKDLGWDGVFLTNHFLDGNLALDATHPYEERLNYFFKDTEDAIAIGKEIGIKVFSGVELAYGGTDFLAYGLDKAWYMAHPEIMEMKKSEELPFLRDAGALIVHAHPFREAPYIDHIRLYPNCVEGVEIYNAGREARCNQLGALYAGVYDFIRTAGSDNHTAQHATKLAGIETDRQLETEADFIACLRAREHRLFRADRENENAAFTYTEL